MAKFDDGNGELFPSGDELKEKGINRVWDNTHEAWRAGMLTALESWYESGLPFTVDDATALAGMPERRNAVGAAMSKFRRSHPEILILRYVKGTRSSSQHSRKFPLYKKP